VAGSRDQRPDQRPDQRLDQRPDQRLDQRLTILEEKVRTQRLQLACWEQDYAEYKTSITATLAGIGHGGNSNRRLNNIREKFLELSNEFLFQKGYLNEVADNVSKSFQNVVAEIHQKTSEFERKISSLKTIVAKKARFDQSLNDMKTIQYYLQTFQNRLQTTNTELQRNELTVTAIKLDIQNLRNMTKAVENNSIEQSEPQKQQVAFSVGTNTDTSNDMGSDETIIFDRVITNIGNCYSKDDGTFTAPMRGIYFFFVNILTSSNARGGMSIGGLTIGDDPENLYTLKRNGDHILALTSTTFVRESTDSNFIVVELAQGDRITVVKYGDQSSATNVRNMWTTFSGYMLFGVGTDGPPSVETSSLNQLEPPWLKTNKGVHLVNRAHLIGK